MDEKLFLEEWLIEDIYDSSTGKSISLLGPCIDDVTHVAGIPFHYSELRLLEKLLGCNVNDFRNKYVTVVVIGKGNTAPWAIGYQGLYFFEDNLVSESELCENFGIFDIVRINRNGEKIANYTVPQKNIGYVKTR